MEGRFLHTERGWDISTEETALWTLQRVKQNGTRAEKISVYRAVSQKFPHLPQCQVGFTEWDETLGAG